MSFKKNAIYSSIALAASTMLFPAVASAATPPTAVAAIVTTNQSIIGLAAGNGVQQSKTLLGVLPAGTPLIGIGALSADPQHYGSLLSISLLNTGRLVGIDIGPGGSKSPNTISITNPSKAPVLSGLVH